MNYLKKTKTHLPIIFLLFLSCSVAYTQATAAAAWGGALERIQKDIENIEQYLGFTPPSLRPSTPTPTLEYSSNSNQLIKEDGVKKSPTFMSITPANSATANLFSTFSANFNQPWFIPVNEEDPLGTHLNRLENLLFEQIMNFTNHLNAPLTNKQSSAQPLSSAQKTATIMSPVSQAVLNILSVTPDSYCPTNPTSSSDDCPFNYTASKLIANALGLTSSDSKFDINSFDFSTSNKSIGDNFANLFPQDNQKGGNPQQRVLSQVDSSVFLSPLVYTTTDSSEGNSCGGGLNCGLDSQADSQLKNAVNFVSHVSGTILPSSVLPTMKNLQDIQSVLTSKSEPLVLKNSAFQSLGAYIIGTRIYAARESVGLQNIYEILARRIPIPDDTGSPPSSQALNEFIMATYRLFTPNQLTPGASSWQNKINLASSTTVQKETALLLSEINYQLYLMRQQQERLVLTNSVLLISNLQLQYPQIQPIK